jgi:hypothetical protein
MIQILILEDNISKVHKLVNSEYLKFTNKAWVVTAHQSEAERQVGANEGRQLEALYLDRELGPGCGDGLNFLRNLQRTEVKKVYGISFSKDAIREMQDLCREKGIEFEWLRL